MFNRMNSTFKLLFAVYKFISLLLTITEMLPIFERTCVKPIKHAIFLSYTRAVTEKKDSIWISRLA